MTALVIILIIIAIILFLLFSPVHLFIDYNGKETHLSIRYLCIKIQLLPEIKKEKKKKPKKKKEPQKKEQPKKKKSKEESFLKKLLKAEGVSGVAEILHDAAAILRQLLSSVTKHILIKKLQINIVTGGEDAAKAAMNFGYACDAVYTPLGLISAMVQLWCEPQIEIQPNFDSKSSSAFLFAHAEIRPAFVIIPTVINGIKALKLYFRMNESVENSKNKADK